MSVNLPWSERRLRTSAILTLMEVAFFCEPYKELFSDFIGTAKKTPL